MIHMGAGLIAPAPWFAPMADDPRRFVALLHAVIAAQLAAIHDPAILQRAVAGGDLRDVPDVGGLAKAEIIGTLARHQQPPA